MASSETRSNPGTEQGRSPLSKVGEPSLFFQMFPTYIAWYLRKTMKNLVFYFQKDVKQVISLETSTADICPIDEAKPLAV